MQRYRRSAMAGLEIHPLSELRDEAARLLAERFARQRAAEPLLPEVDDFEAVLDLDEVLYVHQEATPSFSGYATPPREKLREEEAGMWDDRAQFPFVAEVAGEVVGLLLLFLRPEGDLRVPVNNIDLAF